MLEPKIGGWFDFAGVYDAYVAAAADGAVFVEVGCFLGLSTIHMAKAIAASGKRVELWCVDTWDNRQGLDRDHLTQRNKLAELGVPPGRLFEQFAANCMAEGAWDALRVVRAESTLAARLFEFGDVDLVFLDAGHSYGDVLADLKAWAPVIKRGGILAGHDYDPHGHPELVEALHRFAGSKLRVERSGKTCWQIRL